MTRPPLPLAFALLLGCTTAVPPDDPGEADDDDAGLDQPCELPDACTLQTNWGSPATLEVVTRGIWAIWWDPAFDHAGDAPILFDQLEEIREECLGELGMADPPNPAAGFYYNVYIHHGADDVFPEGWGNGQGTDPFGMPFLTLPDGAHLDRGNLYHEGFHVFQYSADSPGFAYSGDSQWYVESSAQWYSADHMTDDLLAFVEAGAIAANPHLALWHSFGNEAPGDPTDWLFQVRQYGMHTWLYYLTSVAGVDPARITEGFYDRIAVSPQRYHYDTIGAEPLRAAFADWAAANTAGFTYLTPEQVARARQEVEWVGDPANLAPFVLELQDAGTDRFSPDPVVTTRGWSYNVIRVEAPTPGDWSFELDGAETGLDGSLSTFAGRVLVLGDGAPDVTALAMSSARSGGATVPIPEGATEVFLIVAAVPESFEGNQTFPWSASITRP